jgi:hypothetical protein
MTNHHGHINPKNHIGVSTLLRTAKLNVSLYLNPALHSAITQCIVRPMDL